MTYFLVGATVALVDWAGSETKKFSILAAPLSVVPATSLSYRLAVAAQGLVLVFPSGRVWRRSVATVGRASNSRQPRPKRTVMYVPDNALMERLLNSRTIPKWKNYVPIFFRFANDIWGAWYPPWVQALPNPTKKHGKTSRPRSIWDALNGNSPREPW